MTMGLLLALLLTAPASAEDDAPECDLKALEAELEEASPIALPEIYVQIARCAPERAEELAPEVMPRVLAGDEGNAAAEAAIEVGQGDEVRQWLDGLEPDERSRTIAHLGSRCKASDEIADFFVESREALGEVFWKDRWHRGLADCRTEGIQTLLAEAIEGDVAGRDAEDRFRFRSLLEVYARNLGADALPKLAELALTLEEEDDIVFVVSAFADAANVGAEEGMDIDTSVKAVAALEAIGGQLPPKAVDQARTTLRALGAEEFSDQFATHRWRDRKTPDDEYRYMAVAIEDVTCKNGKKMAWFHWAPFTEPGRLWPEQLDELLRDKLVLEWELDQAERCKGEGSITIEMPSEPLTSEEAAETWLEEKRTEFKRATLTGYKRTRFEEHDPFQM